MKEDISYELTKGEKVVLLSWSFMAFILSIVFGVFSILISSIVTLFLLIVIGPLLSKPKNVETKDHGEY